MKPIHFTREIWYSSQEVFESTSASSGDAYHVSRVKEILLRCNTLYSINRSVCNLLKDHKNVHQFLVQ